MVTAQKSSDNLSFINQSSQLRRCLLDGMGNKY